MSQFGPKIYTEEYYEALEAIEGRHWWTLGMDDIMDRLLLPRLSAGAQLRVIDMGCGSGVGLRWVRSRLNPTLLLGVDISHFGIQRCRNKGAQLLVGSVTSLPVQAGSTDLTICNDVLQHVDNDQDVVNEAFRILSPGGLFYARTNGKFITPRLPGCLRLYTSKDLRRLLERAGFETLVVSSANAVGSLFGVCKHYLATVRHDGHEHGHAHAASGRGHGSEEAGPGGILIKPSEKQGKSLIEKAMRGMLRIEGTLMNCASGIVPFGHTHIVLARKPDGVERH